MWEMFLRDGASLAMPADSFVFWSTLVGHVMVSNTSRTSVLWCMEDTNLCFGATMLDTELWLTQHGNTVSGQWRIVPHGQLTLLKPHDPTTFPSNSFPSWLAKKLENK
jgi:hypothetical protein